MNAALTRRRALTVAAAAAGFGLYGLAPGRSQAAPPLHRWRGVVLGAQASILLNHPHRDAAEVLIRGCVAEIARLESVFSLYRPDSALTRLNRDGVLVQPPLELVQLLSESRQYARMTSGAFDVTVQPLWQLYATHFSSRDADPAGPSAAAIAAARALVDYCAVSVAADRIVLSRPGMAVTLNGIAQGYITDRVADLLRAGGLEHVLIDLGEIRALGPHADGRPWRIGLADLHDRAASCETIKLSEGAVASSSGQATRFEPSGRFHHLFDPVTGESAGRYLGVTVLAPRATEADALSTAFAVMPLQSAKTCIDRLRSVRARWLLADGSVVEYRT
jgi:thiamine biosynthesis lipoprotein